MKKNGLRKGSWQKLYRSKNARFSALFFMLLISGSIAIPMINPHKQYATHPQLSNHKPCSQFWFGSDEIGRDLFSRIWMGVRISLLVGVSATAINMLIGLCYGAFAGMMGGKTEECMMRAADVLYALPYLLLTIVLTIFMPPGFSTILVALTLTGWINTARIIRGEVLKIKEYDFVLAAHMLGASYRHILLRHLVPNLKGVIIALTVLTIPSAIFAETFLSFLGVGIQPPMSSLGTMLREGLFGFRYYPWRFFFPAIFLCMTTFAINFLGDKIRDAFDPRYAK